MTTYFCDGLKEVTVFNGVARLEFQRLEAVERGHEREVRPVTEFVVALPLQGFVQALSILEQVRQRFVAEGVIGGPQDASPPPPPPAKSPNFS